MLSTLRVSVLYRIWRERLSQLIPAGCKYHRYRLTNMLLLVVGIYKARSVHLSIFRIGWGVIERCLALDDPIPITFVPDIDSVAAG